MILWAVNSFPRVGLRTEAEPQMGLLCLMVPCTAPFQQAQRLGRIATAVYLGRMSDTSFPLKVSIFFTDMVLEELVLVQLKEPEPPPELKRDWKLRV